MLLELVADDSIPVPNPLLPVDELPRCIPLVDLEVYVLLALSSLRIRVVGGSMG